jgi:adenylate cyclase
VHNIFGRGYTWEMNVRKFRRLVVFAVIALVAWGVAVLPRVTGASATQWGDDFFYDAYYHTRPVVSEKGREVVIVTADEESLNFMTDAHKWGWPWPRQVWGMVAGYCDQAGAKALVFDFIWAQPSARGLDDDQGFEDEIAKIKAPIIWGNEAKKDGTWGPFSPKIDNPIFGAVNVNNDKIYRRYNAAVMGKPSLAVAAVKAAGLPPKLPDDRRFMLHYYGPHDVAGETTFYFIPAAAVFSAITHPKEAEAAGFNKDVFKDKIVVFGTSAIGTYDLKSTPLSSIYPGAEVQATAIANMIQGDQAVPVAALWRFLAPLLSALLVTAGVIFPRRATLKTAAPVLVLAVILTIGILLFRGNTIRWFAPTDSLLALAIATPVAFAWTYFAEDRQRRFMLKALSKVVSPAIAEQLAQNPERLQLGTVRGELTLIFTDLANFTDLAETMDVQTLGKMLNRYLGEMSDQVLAHDGTLDKYIGDAVMCFWNAPLAQTDHAAQACRAALAMAKREREIAAELEQAAGSTGAAPKKIYTRIGINTTTAAVGFVGSSHLFNYTALGDGVNLGSRLEGANKIYGTRIMLSENTAKLVKDQFLLRRLDVLRVKGKKQPMAVFELIAERHDPADSTDARERVALYEAGLEAYERQQWELAEKKLLELLERFGQDGPSKTLLGRIAVFRQYPPGEDWDGVYVAKDK